MQQKDQINIKSHKENIFHLKSLFVILCLSEYTKKVFTNWQVAGTLFH